jgi:hypothetical protein
MPCSSGVELGSGGWPDLPQTPREVDPAVRSGSKKVNVIAMQMMTVLVLRMLIGRWRKDLNPILGTSCAQSLLPPRTVSAGKTPLQPLATNGNPLPTASMVPATVRFCEISRIRV